MNGNILKLTLGTSPTHFAATDGGAVQWITLQFRGSPPRLHVANPDPHSSVAWLDTNDYHRTLIVEVRTGIVTQVRVLGRHCDDDGTHAQDLDLRLHAMYLDDTPVMPVTSSAGATAQLGLPALNCGTRPYSWLAFYASANFTGQTANDFSGDPLVILVPKPGVCAPA